MCVGVRELLPLFVAVPLGIAFLMPLLGKLRRDRLLDVLAILASLVLFALTVAALADGGDAVYWMGNWKPTPVEGKTLLGICLVSDGLSRLLLLIVNVVAFLVVIFSSGYMVKYTSRGLYYSLFFLMVAGMNGVVLTGDFFNLYVFLEIASIASYALVAFGCESEELEASFKYLVLGAIGTLLVLVAVAILYGLTGTLNMGQVARIIGLDATAKGPAYLALGLFLAGFGIKAAMVPFHAWLPDAHPSAPAPISAMLSGVLIKAIGVYALCRIVFNIFGVTPAVANVLVAMGIISMTAGAFLMIGQTDLKRLLAYSSISHMGYVVLAVGVSATVLAANGPAAVAALALFGGLFHLMNHATFKSLLFLSSGAVEYATGTRDLNRLSGLSKTMPVTAGCIRVASLAIAGVPPFNGFFSKMIIVIAVVWAGHYWLAAAALLVSFVTLLTFVKVQRCVVQGEPTGSTADAREVPASMTLPMIVLTVICMVAGVITVFYAPFRAALFDPAADAMMDKGNAYIQKFELPEQP